MSELSPENSDGNAVEECPAPPRYYKLFSSVKIAPPVLPDITNVTAWSSDHQYNGAITAQMTNQDVANVPNELYKAEMQRFEINNVTDGPLIDFCSTLSFQSFDDAFIFPSKKCFIRNYDNRTVYSN